MAKQFNEIKKNIIENFFNKNYKYSCVSVKNAIVNDIKTRSMFGLTYDIEKDIMRMDIGDGIEIDFKFEWEEKTYHSSLNKDVKMYKLINIA